MQIPLHHTTVLLAEAVDALLNPLFPAAESQPHALRMGTFVDATFGRGGHSALILSQLSAQAKLVAFDKDPQAVEAARAIVDPRFSIKHESFNLLAQLPVSSIAGVLMDLGISSPQIDTPERGFSFRFDGPLDMRMDTDRKSVV